MELVNKERIFNPVAEKKFILLLSVITVSPTLSWSGNVKTSSRYHNLIHNEIRTWNNFLITALYILTKKNKNWMLSALSLKYGDCDSPWQPVEKKSYIRQQNEMSDLYEGKVKISRPSLCETRDKRPLGWESDRSWCHCHTNVKLFWSQPMAPRSSGVAYECDQESFTLVWWWHQLLSGSLPNGHLSATSHWLLARPRTFQTTLVVARA